MRVRVYLDKHYRKFMGKNILSFDLTSEEFIDNEKKVIEIKNFALKVFADHLKKLNIIDESIINGVDEYIYYYSANYINKLKSLVKS